MVGRNMAAATLPKLRVTEGVECFSGLLCKGPVSLHNTKAKILFDIVFFFTSNSLNTLLTFPVVKLYLLTLLTLFKALITQNGPFQNNDYYN